MNKVVIFMIFFFLTISVGFADFTAADRIKLEKDLKTLKLDKKISKVLTSKEWQKKRKSADLSKKTHKTGIADQLKKIATSYKDISGKHADKFMFPNVLADVLSAADVTNQIKIARDQWKELLNLKNLLNELKDIAEAAEKTFEEEKEELEKDPKKKKKAQKMQIAIDAAEAIANEAENFRKKIIKVDPKSWRDKFQADKDEAVKFAQGTDELKKSGVNPDKLIQAVFTMDVVIFGGKLIDVCDDYLGTVVPDLENLRDTPDQLAQRFNDSYLANDAGSRKISQNTSNIKRWQSNFGANFLYPVADISRVITDFDGWGGGTDSWTPENAVANLDKYIQDVQDLKDWATKYGAQWQNDKNN